MAERPRDATQLEALTLTEVTQHPGGSLPRARRRFKHATTALERFDQMPMKIAKRGWGGGARRKFMHDDDG